MRPETFETERLAEMGLETTRCRGMQILGGAKDFCPNLLKLTRKIRLSKMIKTFFGSHTKNIFMCILEKKKSNSDIFRQ